MKILITGVNGFIGRCLARHFLKRGITVHGLDIQEESDLVLHKYYSVDVREPFHLSENYQVVIHLAGIGRTNVDIDYDYSILKKVNVDGVINTIHSCQYEKFMFLSSVLVYARECERVVETSELRGDSVYSQTKIEAEEAISELLPQDSYVIFRTVNVIGSEQRKVACMPVFFDKAMKNEQINIFVPANKIMQLIDVDDLCTLFEKAAIEYPEKYGIYNVAPKEYIEIRELVDKIIETTKSKAGVLYSNQNLEKVSVISAQKARETYNWNSTKTFDEIISNYYLEKYNGVSNFDEEAMNCDVDNTENANGEKCIVFDFDGVINNLHDLQVKALEESYRQVVGEGDVPFSEFFQNSGDSLKNIFEKLGLPAEMIPIYTSIR